MQWTSSGFDSTPPAVNLQDAVAARRYTGGAMNRRTFALACGTSIVVKADGSDRPNILWITCEDIGPQLGCYGDTYAKTPNLDVLASRGARYRMAWSNAPVCAPARTTIISGMYPTSTGSEHMRSLVKLPEGMRMYPWY